MKQRGSIKKVLSITKQKVKSAVEQVKQKVRAQRAVNLYERLIGIKPTKTVVVSPERIRSARRSLRRSVRRSVRRLRTSPLASSLATIVPGVQTPVVKSRVVRRRKVSRRTRSRSPKKM